MNASKFGHLFNDKYCKEVLIGLAYYNFYNFSYIYEPDFVCG